MMLLQVAASTALLCGTTLAFTPLSAHSLSSRSSSSHLFLTSEEILARARQATGISNDDDEEDERPKLFDDFIYADIASAYEKLDKRFKEGPGSLTAGELRDLEAELRRIGGEMKQNQHKRPQRPSTRDSDNSSTSSTALAHPERSGQDSDTAAEHEGPDGFDGKFGVARGTTNTYAIDGMDEMTAEEYQVAIQEAVSARQRQRRATGVVGNQTSQNYLDALNSS